MTRVATPSSIAASAALAAGPSDAAIGIVFAATAVSTVAAKLAPSSDATVPALTTFAARNVDDDTIQILAYDDIDMRSVLAGAAGEPIASL